MDADEFESLQARTQALSDRWYRLAARVGQALSRLVSSPGLTVLMRQLVGKLTAISRHHRRHVVVHAAVPDCAGDFRLTSVAAADGSEIQPSVTQRLTRPFMPTRHALVNWDGVYAGVRANITFESSGRAPFLRRIGVNRVRNAGCAVRSFYVVLFDARRAPYAVEIAMEAGASSSWSSRRTSS